MAQFYAARLGLTGGVVTSTDELFKLVGPFATIRNAASVPVYVGGRNVDPPTTTRHRIPVGPGETLMIPLDEPQALSFLIDDVETVTGDVYIGGLAESEGVLV